MPMMALLVYCVGCQVCLAVLCTRSRCSPVAGPVQTDG